MEAIQISIKEQFYNQYRGLRYNLTHEEIEQEYPAIANKDNKDRYEQELKMSSNPVLSGLFQDFNTIFSNTNRVEAIC